MTAPHHATCVAIGDAGIVIVGPSGSGKSDLALRLIDRGAMLVSDDYTILTPRDGELIASSPPTIAGHIEVRGIGILPFPTCATASVRLVVRLTRVPPRLPEPAHIVIAEVSLPVVDLDPLPASAPIKVELALARLVEGI